MIAKDCVMAEEVIDWFRTGYCDQCIDQSSLVDLEAGCAGCYVKEAIDRVLWLENQRHQTVRERNNATVQEEAGGAMKPGIELRWLERWVPDKETDGRFVIKDLVLQRRLWKPNNAYDLYPEPGSWTEWQDVPVHVEVEP